MTLPASQLLANNLRKLMASGRGPSSQLAIHKQTGVSQSTVGRMLSGETSSGVDTVQSVAELYGLQAWHLLLPDLDVRNPQAAPMSQAEIEFYARLRALFETLPDRPR
jgi:transcriptional regulator with XRE-family HTH domain